MLYPLLLSAVLATTVATDVYDVTLTSIGLKKKLAIEGFNWLVGSNPSTAALYLRDSLMLGFCTVPTVLFHTLLHNVPLQYAALAAPLAYAVKHVLGGLAWKKLGA